MAKKIDLDADVLWYVVDVHGELYIIGLEEGEDIPVGSKVVELCENLRQAQQIKQYLLDEGVTFITKNS